MNENTARIIPSETDPQHGTRYTLKHIDGREALLPASKWGGAEWHLESYATDLLWAEWQMGNIEWSPF